MKEVIYIEKDDTKQLKSLLKMCNGSKRWTRRGVVMLITGIKTSEEKRIRVELQEIQA